MERIDKVTIVGMGALGTLYGSFFSEALGVENVEFLADKERLARIQGREVYCNGKPWRFHVRDGLREVPGKKAQLLIFAVKATGLDAAIETARAQVGEDTIILSVLNGISSEEIIGRELGAGHVLYCVAQGMDAVKISNTLTYTLMGQLIIGFPKTEPKKAPLLATVREFFDRTKFPYTVEEDILRRLWCKWMLNVGVNQVVMVKEGNYGTVHRQGEARELMLAAMKEVALLAKRENISVTEEDALEYMALVDTLSPEGMPSMRQDGLLKRPSEVEFFSGEVLRRAARVGLEAPVNRRLYEQIKKMEAAY